MAEAKKPKAHVANYKKELVKKFTKLFEEYPIIGLVNMENLPSAQLNKMRAQLRGKVEMGMTKKRILYRAIENVKSKKGIEEIKNHITGVPALIFTRENPFSLFKTIQKSKSSAPAKPGQIAPMDLVIEAGPTPFAPGPVIGEFGKLGIKTGVEAGKIVVKDSKVVAVKGEKIKPEVAAMLARLNIQPMEIGLDLVAVYEKGIIFGKDVLAVDEKVYIEKVKIAGIEAVNLSVYFAYPTKDTVNMLIGKSFNNAKSLAVAQSILADEVAELLIQKAEREMLNIRAQIE